jgi:hypothetical protein
MKHTRKDMDRVRRDLNLDSSPDDEFMRLLAEANTASVTPRPAGAEAVRGTPAELESLVQTATASELLRRAKAASERSYADVAAHLGVSRQRAAQIIQGDNLELETLVRTAAAMGYETRLSLHPVAKPGRDFTAVLPAMRYACEEATLE